MSGLASSRYRVRLAAKSAPSDALRTVIADLQEEIEARPHLASPSVEWDAGQALVYLEVTVEDPDPDAAGKSMREELLEIIPAVLADFDEIAVEIIEVAPQVH